MAVAHYPICWLTHRSRGRCAIKPRSAPELRRCHRRFAPATTGRRISIRMVARREAPHNHADQADSGRNNRRLYRPSRLIRRPVSAQGATMGISVKPSSDVLVPRT